MGVHEEGYIREVVVMVDDVGQVDHSFMAFVFRYEERFAATVNSVYRGRHQWLLGHRLNPHDPFLRRSRNNKSARVIVAGCLWDTGKERRP